MNLTNLSEELKFEVLLYLNDYLNNLFIYIYDTKKQKVLRKVNKQHSFFLIKHMLEFKKRYPPIILHSNDTQNFEIFHLFYCKYYRKNKTILTGYYSYYTGYEEYWHACRWQHTLNCFNKFMCDEDSECEDEDDSGEYEDDSECGDEDDYNSIKYRINVIKMDYLRDYLQFLPMTPQEWQQRLQNSRN